MLPTRTSSPAHPSIASPDSALRRHRRAATANTLRRRHGATALVIGAALGVATIGGLTTSAAASDIETVVAAALPAGATGHIEAFSGITADARTTLEMARAAAYAAADARADLAGSGLVVDGPTAVSTSALEEHIERLSSLDLVPMLLVPDLTDDALAETRKVSQLTADLRVRLDAAQKQAAAEKAAKEKAAAEAAAQKEREAAAAALAAANTVEGAKASARSIAAAEYGWGADQFSCLDSLWTKESGWDYRAYNASSGATGIPQSLPGTKMATAGADWQTNAATQIRWGLGYIAAAYGTPCSAWGHSQATNWY
jgi:hypothetical protein